MCDCGCGTCSSKKPVVLNESLAPKAILSEGLKYHMDNALPLTEHVFRAGSTEYFNLWAEARALYARNILEVQGDDLEVILETDLGNFGILEDGTKVPLDFPILEEGDLSLDKKRSIVRKIIDVAKKSGQHLSNEDLIDLIAKQIKIDTGGSLKPGEARVFKEILAEEAKKKLNKPMCDSSGGKAYKVYVKDPKTKKIKTVRFGSGGLRAKINNKDARNAFAARHKCSTKKDKTKAGYWSCRLPRYAKLLGLKSNFSGFW